MKLKKSISVCCLSIMMLCSTGLGQVTVTYKSSDEVLRNPERGFYTELTSQAEQSPLTPASLAEIKAHGESLVLRMYYLKSFRDRPLSDAELSIIKNDFITVRQAGMKCIPRFAYSENIGQQDAPLNVVLGHIAQLKPILQENSDVIAAMQAGFVGAWGEGHSSTNGLDEVANRKKILVAMLDALPADRMIQVRTPRYKREMFNRTLPIAKSEAFNEAMYSRVGHHNDCFLANWNDYGTYVDTVEEEDFLSKDCLYVPMGGETCNPSSFSDCANSLYQMKKLHWSFLHSGYHRSVVNGWKTNGCFDEIAKKLGYRFQLLSGVFDDSSRPGAGFHYSIRLTNTGFAALFNPRDVELIIQHQSKKIGYLVKLPDDPRFWQPGDTVSLSGIAGLPDDMPSGSYDVYLNLPDPAQRLHYEPDYSIRCANDNMWDANSGYNKLNCVLKVKLGKGQTMYTGLYYFQPLEVPERNKEKKHDDKN